MIAGHVRPIGLGRGHVSRAILREHDSTPTRRQDRIAIDEVRFGICWKKPWNAQADAVEAHEIHAVTLPAVWRESLPLERPQMRVGKRLAAAVHHEVGAASERKRQVDGIAWWPPARECQTDNAH